MSRSGAWTLLGNGVGLLALLLLGLVLFAGCDSSSPVTSTDDNAAVSGLAGAETPRMIGGQDKGRHGNRYINPRIKVHPFQGITETDENGNIISEDPDDWCYAEEPGEYAFLPAYPNPTDDSCTLVFVLPEAATVDIMVTKWVGDPIRVVRRLVSGDYPAGTHTVVWDGRDDDGELLGADIYRVVMSAGEFNCYGDIQIVEP